MINRSKRWLTWSCLFFILYKGVTDLKVRDHLTDEQQKQLGVKKKEKLTDRDLKELMGTSRDRYKRHRGAMRRK